MSLFPVFFVAYVAIMALFSTGVAAGVYGLLFCRGERVPYGVCLVAGTVGLVLTRAL